ncbi:MAG: acyl carrier protein [Succinivibrio sp.]|nr:acyl carrier protein [Succinivibrio sp.]
MKSLLEVLKTVNNEADFEHESNLIGDGIFSSLDMLNVITALEEEYGVEIPPGEINAENFNSLAAIEALLKRLS